MLLRDLLPLVVCVDFHVYVASLTIFDLPLLSTRSGSFLLRHVMFGSLILNSVCHYTSSLVAVAPVYHLNTGSTDTTVKLYIHNIRQVQ